MHPNALSLHQLIFESFYNHFTFIEIITVRWAFFHVNCRFSLGFFHICCCALAIRRIAITENMEILTAIQIDGIETILDIYMGDSARGWQS